ncbi:MAG: MarC family protein [Pseudomonadota bacterium]
MLSTLTTFLVVVDPIGTIPVFIAATRGLPSQDQRHIALQAVFFAALILLFFVLFGQIIITSIGIDLASFQLAGGVILFIFALNMVFGDGKPAEEIKELTAFKKREISIFPLAIPSIASPGAMLAAVTLTDNRDYSFWQQTVTTGLLLSVLLLTLLLLIAAAPINRLIGMSGAALVSRVMGIILAAFAVESIVESARILAATF